MLTCSGFRTVAIQTPTLWSVLDFTRGCHEWRELCLNRSASMSIGLRIDSLEAATFLKRAWKANVQENAVIAQVLNEGVSSRLRVLAIELTAGNQPELHITQCFLGVAQHSLTHLSMDGLQIRLVDPPSLTSLRRLVLIDIRVGVNLKNLFSLLQGAPRIEDLWLQDLYPEGLTDATTITPISQRVSLPKLKTLVIKDTLVEASAAVRLVPLPSSSLTITVYNDDEEDDAGNVVANHVIIYDFYISFLKTLPEVQEPSRGTLIVGFDADTDRILFGRLLTDLAQAAGMYLAGDSDTVCLYVVHNVIAFDLSLPLFAHVDTLHITCVDGQSLPASWNGHLFPKVDTLVICKLEEEGLLETKNWITGWEGQIKDIQFISCHTVVEQMGQDLQRERLAANIIWMP
jgi:hypothetical protein